MRFTGILLIGFMLALSAVDGQAGMDAGAIVKKSGVTGGLIVNLGCKDGKFTAGLAVNENCIVQGLDTNSMNVDKARAYLQKQGLYGKIKINEFDGKNLPYIDNMVNLLVADDLGQVSQDEVMRVLAPLGVAMIGGKKIVKEWPSALDEWTHYLYDSSNNAVSKDKIAGPPRHMQWKASPAWTRHHDKLASMSALVTSRGRMFCIADQGPIDDPDYHARWVLEARDAFNGILLWTKPMKSWVSHERKFRSGPVQLARLLVADKDRIFVAMGINEPVSVLASASGKLIRKLDSTANAEEIVMNGSSLFVIRGNKSAEQAYDKKANYHEKALTVVSPDTGKFLWRYPAEGFADIIPQTLAASGSKVVFQKGTETVCLNADNGKPIWSKGFSIEHHSNSSGKKQVAKKRRGLGVRSAGWSYNTLVLQDDVVLSCDNKMLYALSLESGSKLWEAPANSPFGKVPSVDILVIDGLVWTSPSLDAGRDLHTGEVVREIDTSEIVTAGHHHRCYRDKGTGDFIVYGHRGMDFLDTRGDNHSRNDWVRGLCQYGVMPANGLMYAPPNNCGCYPEAILHAFWALAPAQSRFSVPDDFKGTLRKGPAYKDIGHSTFKIRNTDWPTYRSDKARSGSSETKLSSSMKEKWRVKIGGDITAPVVAEGVVLLAEKLSYVVYALDMNLGKELWRFTAGGQVDSPPTIYGDSLLFGASDGCVYSLSLKDGSLRWRFNAAPLARDAVAMGQVESLWPVDGSILVKKGVAYFAAGRDSYLDGGIFLFGLDATSGAVKYSTRIKGEYPGATENVNHIESKKYTQNQTDYKTFTAPDKSDAFSMEGNVGDILTADNDSIYLRHMRFNDRLEREKEFKHHLFSTGRFLDDNEAHREHFFYGNGDFSRLPVAYEWMTRGLYGAFSIPAAKLMVFDSDILWGASAQKGMLASNIQGLDDRDKKDFPAVRGKAGGEKIWTAKTEIHPRAMVKAGEKLFVGGSQDTTQLLAAADGGILKVMSASDGAEISTEKLDAVPVFDGMAAADGKLFISLQDGVLICQE